MTQQFKFGDRVKYRATDFLFIHDKGDGRAHVVSETGASGAVLISDLTLISHPDTVRLDWLADAANNIGNVLLPTECVEQHLDSLRDAIDAAMQIQAAETA